MGPGSRIPGIVISHYAKAGTVDSTAYDTPPITRFIIKRFIGTNDHPAYAGDLLPGLAVLNKALRDQGVKAQGAPQLREFF